MNDDDLRNVIRHELDEWLLESTPDWWPDIDEWAERIVAAIRAAERRSDAP